ncbi:tetratricopeptide repeat protein [Salibacterium lacus]|uniref:Tetratricopeptide repeat protein n=1 Tax=Salibacterium lacus TaxID=1898109 RepID=A0ABW5SZQ4_9BACI
MKEKKDPEHNVISFPGSADRLSTQGLEALKAGNKEEAVSFFKEALQHDTFHEEASYGLLLGFAETGRLTEGVRLAEDLMDRNNDNYFEVLQVYVSLLAQAGEYQKVVTILEGVQEEHRFPAKMAEQLFELLELSRTMAETTEEPDVEEALPDRDWNTELKSEGAEYKLSILQEMKEYPSAFVVPSVEILLTDPEISPLLKSMLLFLLKDFHIDREVVITKLERTGTFIPASLPSLEGSSVYIKAGSFLHDALGHEEPVLLEHSLELLKELLLYYYPFPPPLRMDGLAAVVHAEAAGRIGYSVEIEDAISHYNISRETFCEVKEEYDTLKTEISHV